MSSDPLRLTVLGSATPYPTVDNPYSYCLDQLLRAVADDAAADVLITDTGLERIHHPYDGGADVLLTSTDERDRLRARHADWLSSHPDGL
ncbi:hypothetical protein OG535_10485 [Kitasatospora sp. NBC_00085]|uniref:DUF3885 domain-containing protein n=1 Tax=unclassified Kitasatospora TaxID=2633591 RepID=UPI003244F677